MGPARTRQRPRGIETTRERCSDARNASPKTHRERLSWPYHPAMGPRKSTFFGKSPHEFSRFFRKNCRCCEVLPGLGPLPVVHEGVGLSLQGEPKVLPFSRGLGTKNLEKPWTTMRRCNDMHMYTCIYTDVCAHHRANQVIRNQCTGGRTNS